MYHLWDGINMYKPSINGWIEAVLIPTDIGLAVGAIAGHAFSTGERFGNPTHTGHTADKN
jgi:hypothetical protein